MLVTVGIVYVLVSESVPFFKEVALVDFLTDTQWTPMFENARFGVMTLVSATLTVAGITLAVAIPAGRALATYLSEFTSPRGCAFCCAAVASPVRPRAPVLPASRRPRKRAWPFSPSPSGSGPV